MAWSHLDVTKPHLVYIILGGFTSLFMLCSTFIKERMYIGEATVATLCGVIFGPHAANLINPNEWGSVDIVTLEFSRIVLVVQCFAIGVELPKFYMEKHWRSVVFLLIPVMTAGWLLVSLFIWWMIGPLDWLESLVISACVTATDPVLASSVVGKGKFAKRVPKHLRDLLSAESGCNDGMAFPFIYLSLYLIQYHRNASEVTFHFVVYVILYECIFGAIYGFILGYIARHGIKYAEKHDLVDRESFLVFYFVLALFCAGSGSILGLDDLLVGFACGVGFSNDGWFSEKTEESHVSNVIDLLLNLAYFVYFGTIIPWEQYNNNVFGIQAWRLVVIAIFVLLFRRIPIMMALKPLIPDVRTWREALFAGHFGPIGVGAIFVAILARAELEHKEPVPLAELPPETSDNYKLLYLVWPIVTFLVISSILIHGSSIAVFTLGKRINTLTLTMSYTAAPDDGPTWMNRLPRISSQSRSQARMSEASFDERKDLEFPPGSLAPPLGFLRRQKDEDGNSRSGSRASSLVSKKRKNKKWDEGVGPGGPVSQSAIFPNRPPPVSNNSEKDPMPLAHENTDSATLSDDRDKDPEKAEEAAKAKAEEAGQGIANPRRATPPRVEVYDEGDHIIFEDEDGEVLNVQKTPDRSSPELPRPNQAPIAGSSTEPFSWSLGGFKRKMGQMYSSEVEKRKEKSTSHRRHEPARAYQFGNTIIVEDEDGEVVKTYQLPSQRDGNEEGGDLLGSGLKYLGLGARARVRNPAQAARTSGGGAEAVVREGNAGATSTPATKSSGWSGFGRGANTGQVTKKRAGQEDDRNIRFTIGGVGQRMTKEDFIREVQQLDARTRRDVVDHSSASPAIRKLAQDGPPAARKAGGQPGSGIAERGGDQSLKESTLSARGRSPLASGRHLSPASPSESPKGHRHNRLPDVDPTETPVERKRRLAVLANQGDEDGEKDAGEDVGEVAGEDAGDEAGDEAGDDAYEGETSAERRRRHAALGVAGDSDSEDEGTIRVPPARKGIRFADLQRDRMDE